MRIGERYDLAAELRDRYAASGRKERGRLLDGYCLATGYNRKYAISMLRDRRRASSPVRRPRARRYEGHAFRTALALIWEASGYICAERLKPFLVDLARLLESHRQLRLEPSTHQLLTEISVSTLRRRLRNMRPTAIWNPRLLRIPSRLKGQVPVVLTNLHPFDNPGHLEIDLVSHSGRYATGEWIYTVSATDLCTGWVEMAPVMTKGQRQVLDGVDQIRRGLPFQVASLHIDNGHEFLNDYLIEYRRSRSIVLSRGRPHHFNDNAHIEQKNGYLIRGLVTDHRLDSVIQLEWLTQLYVLARAFTNCFQPVMRRIGRVDHGTTSRRLHDIARTPLQRLLDTGGARPEAIAELAQLYTTVSPLNLRRQIEQHLARMPRARQLGPGRPRREEVVVAS